MKDPVCGMEVQEPPKIKTIWQSETYGFCSSGCLTKFQTDPAKYIQPKEVSKVSNPKALYTCPMHPEVIQEGPGSCPKCGMALEPKDVSTSADNSEYKDMSKRFWVSLIFSVPIILLAMLEIFPNKSIEKILSMKVINWIAFVLATPIVIWGGWMFFERGVLSVIRKSLNMFTLIGLGVGVAYIYSVVATVFPGIFPDIFKGHGGQVPVYFEAAAVITVLVLLGQVLELKARTQTSDAMRALLNLAP